MLCSISQVYSHVRILVLLYVGVCNRYYYSCLNDRYWREKEELKHQSFHVAIHESLLPMYTRTIAERKICWLLLDFMVFVFKSIFNIAYTDTYIYII